MSGIENKKVKRRKGKKVAVSKAAVSTGSRKTIADPESITTPHTELNSETFKSLEKLMDAHDDDTALKMLSFTRGTNPFLDRERCLLCNCERQDPPEAETIRAESPDKQSLLNNPLAQLPLWVCPSCRKAADQEIEKKPSIEHFLDPESDTFLPDISIKSGSEPTTPNGSICTCDACTERRMIESEHDQETEELQTCWTELRKVVRCLYGSRDDKKMDDNNVNHCPEEEHMTDLVQIKDLVHKLCSRDPHQLFLRLELQVREFMLELQVKLVTQLKSGFETPPQAKTFIQMLLDSYAHLCSVADKMAGLLKELENHLKNFKVTWDLHNKHLFQSIVYSEPSIKSSFGLLTNQLRLGAASKESYTEDTYPNLLHRFLKFDDEMNVIGSVWRDCHELIESYNEEQAELNTRLAVAIKTLHRASRSVRIFDARVIESALKLKQKMLREDWEFFKTQRKILEQQVSKNPKASLSHNLEAQFTETMRLMLQGNKPSQDELTCPRCNRKRCPCDECTITHMITCGIINQDVLDSANAPNPLTHHHNANFLHDPNQYRIDVSPPSMSSTTSSSGASSPIMVDPERLPLPFPETENQTEDEIQAEIEENLSFDDDDDEDDDDEDDEGDDDDGDGDDEADGEEENLEKLEPAEIPDLPPLKIPDMSYPLMPPLMMDEEEALRRADLGKLDPCNCDHCVTQAKLELLKPEENQCQCHVCLQQQGKAVSTSLPQHIPSIVPRPGELHLYPHIHGSTGLHSLGRGHVRPILQPNLYDLHLPNTQRQKSIIQQTKVPLDFDNPDGINEHIYHAYQDWDNTTYDPRLLLGSGKFDSELLPPPPFTSPYTSTLLTEPLSLSGMLSTVSAPAVTSAATYTSSFVPTFANHSAPATTQAATSKITDYLSVLTTKESLGVQLANKHSNQCSNQGGGAGPTHNPPCTRPVTLGGNNTPKIPEKVHSQHCRKHNTQGTTKPGTSLPAHSHNGQVPGQGKTGTAVSRHMEQQAANLKTMANHSHACTHITNNNPVANHLGTLREVHDGTNSTCANGMHLPTSVNNVSVGTSTKCTEPDCDGNHDNDSYDDNCSEKSSSTTNSTNQKEGKYCDCCYCEFFGHGNPPMAPTSKNYAEMRDKLRLRLKKKAETKPEDGQQQLPMRCTGPATEIEVPAPIVNQCSMPTYTAFPVPNQDPMETKGLEELIKFINGTEEDDKKPLSAKAAKRARQKQRKAAEEKARLDAEELERMRRLREEEERRRVAEEKRRLAEEAARQVKTETMSKKQKKQASRSSKSSSKSPTPPPPTAHTVAGRVNNSADGNTDKSKTQKKGKHIDDLPALQVNITYEIDDCTVTPPKVSSANQKSAVSSHGNSSVSTNQNVLKTAASRPTPQGARVASTPPNIDNRLVINAKQNKNKEPQKMVTAPLPHFGNGDHVPKLAAMNTEHIAITLQQQEVLKKQTQQLIQLKLQQEARKQRMLARQQQEQQLQQQAAQLHKDKKVTVKSMQNGAPPQVNPAVSAVVNSTNNKTAQPKVPVKNNVKITVKTSANTTPTNSPRPVEVKNNVNQQQQQQQVKQGSNNNNSRVIQQNEVNRQGMQSPQQQQVANRKGKKPADNLQQQQQSPRTQQKQQSQQPQTVQQNAKSVPASPTPVRAPQQNGLPGAPGSPVKGQVRQPPQGQAQNGDTRTPTPDDKKKGKQQQDDSPPSVQGRNSGGKSKKMKRKNKGSGDVNFIDEVFMPKSESDIEGGDMDEFERELEEFKRFCVDSTPAKREKLQVNINIKDIFTKKKSGLTC